MRTISANSCGSTVGRRNRCATTAPSGKPRVRWSEIERSGTASSSDASGRTSHVLLESKDRTRFQHCRPGIMKTVLGASILQLLPRYYLRNGPRFAKHDLHDARHIARFPNADNSQHRIFETYQSRQLLELVRRKTKSKANIFEGFEWRIVRRAVNSILSAP